MAISKKIREQIFSKYNGRCAYTGKPLDDKWQVDHVIPKIYSQSKAYLLSYGLNSHDDINNLLPSLRIVNHYKRALDLEGWRRYLLSLHLRLKKLPKKTTVPRTEARIKYLREVADNFGIAEDKPFDGKFYFELIPNQTNNGKEI